MGTKSLGLLRAVTVVAALSLCCTAHPSKYLLTSGVLSWTDAELEANSLGGHLVAINSAEEQAYLLAAFGGTEYLWIGLTDRDVEGLFVWTNGDPVTYTSWRPGEPNDEGGTEDYVLINWRGPGAWADGNLASPRLRGIIEVVPEPVTSLLILFAALIPLRARS